MDLHEVLEQISRPAVWIPDWAIAGAAFIVAAILALLDRRYPADPHRRRGDRRERMGLGGGDHRHLCRDQLWDWRRMVVPLSCFLEKPFQNWTRQSTDLIGTVPLWVDYTVPVAPVRVKLEESARVSKLWDEQVVNLQVVDSNERAVQLRALVSARTSPQGWDLRCEVREQLILFLQEEFPNALPKQRAELVGLPGHRRSAAAAVVAE
jgi:hypothetical protein